MRSIQKKKGMSIGDLYPAVLTVLLIGLMLGIGLFVLSTLHRSISVDLTTTEGDTNVSTGTSTLTAASGAQFYLDSVTTIVYNNGTTIGTNYTTTTAGVITWGADIVAEALSSDQNVNATFVYNYDATGMPETAVTSTIGGIDDFAGWIAIIVVVIAAAVVIGIVLSGFGAKRNRI